MKKIIVIMITFSLVIGIIGATLVNDINAWIIGVAFGLILALLRFKLMKNTLIKAVNMPENKAKSYTQRHYMLRYAVTGIALLVSALTPEIDLLGVFVGLISMKVGVYAELYHN